jgi:hypothetical protein
LELGTQHPAFGSTLVLSEDKVSHLSHVILKSLKNASLARVKDETGTLKEIKKVLAAELAEVAQIDAAVRRKLASYSRPVLEGSSEWDVLYRKTYEEETRRRRKV